MSVKAQIVQIGDSLGIELPKSTVERLGIEPGDTFLVHETPDGVELRLTETAELRAMREVARRHRDVLARLAKS